MTFWISRFRRRNPHNPCLNNSGFTLLEISIAVVLLGIALGIAIPSLQKPYARYQLQVTTRQLVSDIREYELKSRDLNSIVPYDPTYKLKFFIYQADDPNSNRYEIWQDELSGEPIWKVDLPASVKMTEAIFGSLQSTKVELNYNGVPIEAGHIDLQDRFSQKKIRITLSPGSGRVWTEEI